MKNQMQMFSRARATLVRSLSAFTAALLLGVVPAVKAETYWLRGPDSSKGSVKSLEKFANDTSTINGFNGSMGWALGDAENPTLPGTRVTSGSMAGHAFIIHEFDASGNFVEPPDYFPASGVNGEPTIANNTEQSVLQDRWPNRESEGYENGGFVPKRFVARTPASAGTFPGEYLELRYGIVMDKANKFLYTINDLRVTGWGVFVAGDSNPNTQSNGTTRLGGNYTVYPGAKFKLAIDSDNSSNSRNLCVLAAGHGSGLLVLGGDNNFVNVAQTLWMNGSLTDFTGPVHLVGHSNTTIQFAYDNSFPADPASPLNDGLIITNGVIAKFTGNATIGANRKVQLFANSDGVAPTIYVEAGKTVRIDSTLTGSNGFTKTGEGTLILGTQSADLSGTVKVAAGKVVLDNASASAETRDFLPNATTEGTVERTAVDLTLTPMITGVSVRRADVTLTLGVGEGVDSAFLMVAYGTGATALTTTNVIHAAATPGVINYTIKNLKDNTTYYCAFTATNALGNTVTTPTLTFKTPSVTTGPRLWVGGGTPQADGSLRWSDHLNWKDGIVPYGNEAVHFPDDTTATIEMPAWAIASSGAFTISNNCNIVLKKSSEVDGDIVYKFSKYVTLPETSSLTLSGSHVWFADGTAADYKLYGNLTVTDGAYFQLNASSLVISNNLVTIEKKSKFGLKNPIVLAGGTKFILDDSELLSEGASRQVTFRNTATLEFKGKAPYANVYVQGANVAGYEPHLIFNIPVGGYGRIPLVNSSGSKMPGDNNPVFCTVDSDSPVFSQSIDKVVPLIVSTNYVNYSKSGNSKVTLDDVEVPPETEAAWVYLPDVMGDADLAGDICTSRESWSNAVPRDVVTTSGAGAVKTLGVYIKGGGEAQLTLSGGTVEPEKTSASVSVKVAWLGEGADSAEVSVIWGESADALVNTNVLESAAVAGQVCNGTITGLSAETTYSYAFTATNGLGQTVTTTPATFTTLAPEALTLADASATAQKTSAEVSVTVSLLGEGATGADVYFAYGPSASELGTPALVKSGAAANETVTAQVSGLMPETTYEYAFSATNNAMPAQFADLAGSFTTLSPDRITLSGLTALAGSNGKSFTATVSVGSLGSGTDPKVSLQYRETGTESWSVAGSNDLTVVGDSEFSVTLAETVADETTFDLRAIASMTEAGVVYATTSTVSQVTLVPPDVPFGADPVIRNGEASVDGGTVRVPYSVEWAGEGKETCSVELAYGLAADDLCFTNEVGSALFGAGTAELANLAPGRTYYMQFTADNGETTGSTAVFSVTIPADGVFPTTFAEGQAVIAGLGAHFLIVDGTAATYSGTFANYVEGAAVTLHYSTDGETWETHSATVTADGFSGSLENLVSGTYICYLTAELDGSTVDRTPEQTIATNGGTTLNSAITVGTAINAITVKFTVSKLGSGSSRTGLVMANVDGVWTEVYSQANPSGSPQYSFDGRTIFDFATAYDLKVVVRDTSADGTVVWENSTATAQFKAADTTVRTYTWTGAGDNDLWNNPANWSVSPTATSAAGYPATENSVVLFPAGVVATVLVSRAESAKVVNVQNAEHVYIKGVSDDASITCQYFRFGTPNQDKQYGGGGGAFDLVLDGITVTETEAFSADVDTSSTLNKTRKNHHHMGDGASLILTNGTVFNSKGNWTPYGDNKGAKNVSIVIEKGSSFNLATCWIPDQEEYKVYGFYLGHDQSRLVLDDTKMTVDGNFVLNDIASSQQPDGSDFLVFKGTNPVLRVTETMVVSDASRMPTTIEFHMPSAGYAESPIQIERNTAPFPLKTAGAAVTPLTLSVIPPDPEDPSSLKFGEAPLVSSAAGFDPNYIKLSPETEKLCQLVFEGENAAGYPTTLRVARRGSTYFLQ